jgi:transposase
VFQVHAVDERGAVAKSVPRLLEDASNLLPGSLRQLITRLTEHLKDLDKLVGEFEAQIKAWHRSSELSMKLEKIPAIGPLGASALVASIADANSFENGRQNPPPAADLREGAVVLSGLGSAWRRLLFVAIRSARRSAFC